MLVLCKFVLGTHSRHEVLDLAHSLLQRSVSRSSVAGIWDAKPTHHDQEPAGRLTEYSRALSRAPRDNEEREHCTCSKYTELRVDTFEHPTVRYAIDLYVTPG